MVKPKWGVFGIFIIAILLSNANQLIFVQANRDFSTPYSFIKLSGFDLIDKLGIRILILFLFCSSIFTKSVNNIKIKELWLIKIILLILLFSVLSMLINNINIRDGLSSISLLMLSLFFISAVINIQLNQRDIQIFLYSMLVFILINAAFQIYQVFIYAFNDSDMTFGLLMSTSPTSTFAFVVSFFFIGKFIIRRYDRTVLLSILVTLVQLVSSYLKGIVCFIIMILISFRKIIFKGWKRLIVIVISLILLIPVIAFTLKEFDESYFNVFLELDNVNTLLNVGPIRVWTEYFHVLDNPVNLIFGYGPSSYGSLNTTDVEGFRKSKLAELISIVDAGNLAGRDIFGTALSSAGNILWENGVIVLVLFILVYYRLFKMSSKIFKNTKSETIKVYAFGVKYEIIFIVLLYFLAFGETTEQILLWGPAFVVFSFIKSEFQLELDKY